MFAAIQTDFVRALLDPDMPPPDAVTAHTARQPQKRFAVYRNNVVVGLINALRAKFPATERIVGDDFFAAMARVFISTCPPRSKILHTYGDDFGDFIAGFEPAADIPYLADVARLEAARTRAYHAADAQPLAPAAFASIAPDAAGALRLSLHPSLQIVRSPHPVVTIWAMNAGEIELGPVDDGAAEDALVLRPGFAVTVRSLPPGGAAFLEALADGLPLGEAAERSAADDARFNFTANLAGLINSGAVAAFTPAEPCPTEGPAS
jgi:hypothetical protein